MATALLWNLLCIARGRAVFDMDRQCIKELFSQSVNFDATVEQLEVAGLIECEAWHDTTRWSINRLPQGWTHG